MFLRIDMKILFIRPKPSPETIGLQHVMIVEPLELEVMASLTGFNDQSVIIDMILEKKPVEYFIKRERPDILCVTGYITNVPMMIHYCRTAKKINPEIVTLVGGVHCEVCPADLDDNAVDFRVVRNATTVFPLLLKYIRGHGDFPKGVLRPKESIHLSELPPLDYSFPFPNRDLTARYRSKYFYIFHNKIALIKTAFGCPHSCNFCFCRKIYNGEYFERPLEDVMKELATIREREIYIVDDDFLISKTRVVSFIEGNRYASLEKKYLIYGRSDFIAQNPDVIESFRKIGLKTVIVGLESFFDHELKLYNKKIDVRTNEEAMKILKYNGIDCYATIILSPEWGKDEFSFCIRKALALGIHYVNLQPFTPLPGIDYKVKEDELLISYSDFPQWDLAHIAVRPQKMNAAEYYKNILRFYGAILFQPKYLIGYVKNYNLFMLWRMIKGSVLVHRQYIRKLKDSKRNA